MFLDYKMECQVDKADYFQHPPKLLAKFVMSVAKKKGLTMLTTVDICGSKMVILTSILRKPYYVKSRSGMA